MIDTETAELLKLDHAGFIPAPGMSREDFLRQTETVLQTHRNFDEALETSGSADIFNTVTVHPFERIAPELLDEAAAQTEELYGFSVRHVPGFYLTKAVGLLWGGCMLSDPDECFSVMLLRNAFRKHRRFLNYTRDELLAHELCHSVRQSLTEITLEEYFAYRTSKSPLRQYLGNCFIRDIDALLFVLPMMMLPAVEIVKALYFPQLQSWIFWIAALIYPAYLLIRNARSRRIVNRARTALKSCGVRQVEAILFRSTLAELKLFPTFSTNPEKFIEWVKTQAETELRWQIILRRFIFEDELINILELEKGSCDHENS